MWHIRPFPILSLYPQATKTAVFPNYKLETPNSKLKTISLSLWLLSLQAYVKIVKTYTNKNFMPNQTKG